MFYTYAHYTPEGRLFYIGKGTGARSHAKNGRNKHWHNVVNKHGLPVIKILAHWETEQEALDHERELIAKYRAAGCKLCNLSDGGKGNAGIVMSDETKLKISETKKGTPAWNKGIPARPEAIEKIAAARRGQPSWNKGVACREETKALLREQRLGKSATWNVGRKHSEETKRKCGAANIGRPASVKQRAIARTLMKGNTYSVGNTNNRKWRWVGRHTKTGETVEFLGSEALNAAGFQHANVIKCINGTRKSHKGYTWAKELLEAV